MQSSTEAVQQTVAQDHNSIAFISFAVVKSTKALQVNSVAPSEATITDGIYKIQRSFFFLVKGEANGSVKGFHRLDERSGRIGHHQGRQTGTSGTKSNIKQKI